MPAGAAMARAMRETKAKRVNCMIAVVRSL